MQQDGQKDENEQGYTEPLLCTSNFAEPFEPPVHSVLLSERLDRYP